MALDSKRDGNLFTKQAEIGRVHRFQDQILLRSVTTHSEREDRNTQIHGGLLRGGAKVPVTITEHKDRLKVLILHLLPLRFESVENIRTVLDIRTVIILGQLLAIRA